MLSPLENQGPIQIFHLKKTNFQENFERFLTHIKEDKKDDLRIAYHKNRELLKASIRLKIPEVEPNFMQTFKMYNQLYCSTRKTKSNVSIKSKTLFIWLISAQETLIQQNFENFNNDSWKTIAQCIPATTISQFKYRLFSYLERKSSNKIWSLAHDSLLKRIMRSLYPNLFQSVESSKIKIKWIVVSIKMCEEIENIYQFKTDKHCKEHWLNHLNPFVNKKLWTLDEDIKLLTENLTHPIKWAEITKSFPGRNQHQIKNRFFRVIGKETAKKNIAIRQMIKDNSIMEYIKETLRILNRKQNKKNVFKLEEEEKNEREENFSVNKNIIIKKEEIATPNQPNTTEFTEIQQNNSREMLNSANNAQNLFNYELYIMNARMQLQYQYFMMSMVSSFYSNNLMQNNNHINQ